MDDLKTCCRESQQTNEVIKIGLIHAIDDSKEKLTAKKNTHKLHRVFLATSSIRQKIKKKSEATYV